MSSQESKRIIAVVSGFIGFFLIGFAVLLGGQVKVEIIEVLSGDWVRYNVNRQYYPIDWLLGVIGGVCLYVAGRLEAKS